MGTQVNLRTNPKIEQNIVDIDDLWVKAPENFVSTPGVYKRQEEENEIDVLWAGLKDTNKRPTPPIVYAGAGFIVGFLASCLVTTILFWGTSGNNQNAVDVSSIEKPVIEQSQKSITVPEDVTSSAAPAQRQYKDLTTYTIQSGDTIGGLAARFYGSSAPKYVDLIKGANNLKSVHSITAGKKLLIPVYE